MSYKVPTPLFVQVQLKWNSFAILGVSKLLNPTFNAFPMLAGTNPNPQSFDLGLPFFYGKRVAVAVENSKTSVGTGPYVAF